MSPESRLSLHLFLEITPRCSDPQQATQGVYEGDIVYLLRSHLLNFVFLICFDCIGFRLTELVSELTHDVRDGDSSNLQLLTVLEHNPRPEHSDFLSFAEHLIVPGTSKLNSGILGWPAESPMRYQVTERLRVIRSFVLFLTAAWGFLLFLVIVALVRRFFGARLVAL